MYSNSNVIIVGIGGCSRCGKTLLVRELINQYNLINKKNTPFSDFCDSIHLDQYANFEKVMKNQVKTKKGNVYENWEFSGSLDWDIFYKDIQQKKNEINFKIKTSQNKNKKGILFIEGFLLFTPLMSNDYDNDDYLNIFDYYIYICLDKKIAKMRRMRTTTVPDDYYEDILWPEHISNCSKYVEFLDEQKYINKKDVLIIDGNKEYNPKDMALCILKWINVLTDNNLVNRKMYNELFTSFENQMSLLKKNFLA